MKVRYTLPLLAFTVLAVVLAFAPTAYADGMRCAVRVYDCSPFVCLHVSFNGIYRGGEVSNLTFSAIGLGVYTRLHSFQAVMVVAGEAARSDKALEAAIGGLRACIPEGCTVTTPVIRELNTSVNGLLLAVGGVGELNVTGILERVARATGYPTAMRAVDATKLLNGLLTPVESVTVTILTTLETMDSRGRHEITMVNGFAVLAYPPFEGLSVLRQLAGRCRVEGVSQPSPLLTLQPFVLEAVEELRGLVNTSWFREPLEEGNPFELIYRVNVLCAGLLAQPERVAGRLTARQASSLAALCSLEPVDSYGLIYSVDVTSYSTILTVLSLAKLKTVNATLAELVEDALASGLRINVTLPDEVYEGLGAVAAYYATVPPPHLNAEYILPPNPVLGNATLARVLNPSNITRMAGSVIPMTVGYGSATGVGEEGEIMASAGMGEAGRPSPPHPLEEMEEVRRMLRRMGIKPIAGMEAEPRARQPPSELLKALRELNISLRLPATRGGGAGPYAGKLGGAVGYSDPVPAAVLALAYLAYLLRAPLTSLAATVKGLLRSLVAGDSIACYEALLDVLRGVGYGRLPWEGPLEHANRLPEPLRILFRDYVGSYVESTYGGRLRTPPSCSVAALTIVWASLRLSFRRAMRRLKGWRAKG